MDVMCCPIGNNRPAPSRTCPPWTGGRHQSIRLTVKLPNLGAYSCVSNSRLR